MRIALIVPGGVDRSGEHRVVPVLLTLVRRLARRHDVHVFALAQEPAPGRWALCGAQVHNIGTARHPLRGLEALWREHRREPFRVVHAIWGGWGGALAVAAGTALRVPSLIHVAGGELVALADIGYGGALTRRGRLREHLVLRAATAVSAASTPILMDLARIGVSAHRVPLGVDLEAWRPRPPRRRTHSTARLIQVADLNRVKDQTTLLEALAILARRRVAFQMCIVGEDTLGGRIQRLARQLGLEGSVHFGGHVPHTRLRPLVAAADLMIHSSRHEAGPLAVLEAAALGVPTVGTAVGHVAEWNPYAAVAVPVGDAVQLAAATQALLVDETRRLEIARAAHVRALRTDAEATVRQFEALYAANTQALRAYAHG